MLSIKGYNDKAWKNWHVGNGPLPDTTGYGVDIKADGHELTWLNEAIAAGANHATKEYYRVVHRTVWHPEDGKYGF